MNAIDNKEFLAFSEREFFKEKFRELQLEHCLLRIELHELKRENHRLKQTLILEQENEFVAGY